MKSIESFFKELCPDHSPSYQALVMNGERVLYEAAGGYASIAPDIKTSSKTLYDLASLTKPILTATLALRLFEEGRLDLDKQVSPNSDKTFRHLLLHNSGLPSWEPLYSICESKKDVKCYLINHMGNYECGKKVDYSCLGYILVGILIEEISGLSLKELWRKFFFDLGNFGHINPEQYPVSAGEDGNIYEESLCVKMDYKPFKRNGIIWGDVHDGNAFFMGGIAGNSGLFATAGEIGKIIFMTLFSPHALLGKRGKRLLLEDGFLNRTHGFKRVKDSYAEGILDDDAVGHDGFTGTSLWIEPEKEMVYILLTNRHHPKHRDEDFSCLRKEFLKWAKQTH